MVQWLGLHPSTAGARGFFFRELRTSKPHNVTKKQKKIGLLEQLIFLMTTPNASDDAEQLNSQISHTLLIRN